MKWLARNYQFTTIKHLLKTPKTALFLDAGLGKTATILATLKLTGGKTLIIAPLRVCYSVWKQEVDKWDNFNQRCTILHGKGKETINDDYDIYLINSEGLPWLYEQMPIHFDNLIVDESTKFKNPSKKTSNGAPSRFQLLVNMLPIFKRRIVMTGTPCANSYLDVWSQIFIVDEGERLGANFFRYKNKYFHNSHWNKFAFILNKGAEAKIQAAIADIVLDIGANGNIELPPIIYNTIDVELTPDARLIYDDMHKELVTLVEDTEIVASASVHARMCCKQIANGAVYDEDKNIKIVHTCKIEALKRLIDAQTAPILVAYEFKHDLIMIRKALGDIPHIGSGVSAKEGAEICDKWNRGEIPVLLGHPKSMAHGLNMQSAGDAVCWFSIPDSLEEYIQLNKRLHRSGVKQTINIYHLVVKKSIDVAIMWRLNEKDGMQINFRECLRNVI